ncbi:hypothetical protein BDV41DRAFT_447229 [Aspergillus transmontanensis]|uniref:Uncharacterized protein n=1 Tax=Aspergillus transmontanensis TaxID=1034304 RepID=A0A5N6WBS9_9EURO|nr:hypothetical protein BDV41DRAFT_447229 [Aspergillus transmontanensis]
MTDKICLNLSLHAVDSVHFFHFVTQEMALPKPASNVTETPAQAPPVTSKEKIAAALSSYVGFPEHLMQKVGFHKHPTLFLASLFVFHSLYYRTCGLVCAADTCHLHTLFLVFLCFSWFFVLVYRGERRDKILRDYGLGLLGSKTT